MTNFTIQIISDAVCPWCYIGHRRLTRAMQAHKAAHPGDTFTQSWHAFYLNPSAAAYPGVEKRAYYDAKFGPERVDALFARLARVGADEGIGFRFGGRTGATRGAHRVVWVAGVKERERRGEGEGAGLRGLQTKVVEGLFRAFFEEERNITDHGVLVDAATGAGMEREEVVRVLESDLGGAEVDGEAERARQGLVTGVPYFTVQGRYAVGGAEEPGVFLEIFNRVKEEEEEEEEKS